MLWAPTMAERAKPCSKCGKEKPLSEYYSRPTAPDGRQAEKSFVLLSRHSNDRPLLKPHSLRSLHAGSVARIYPSLRIADVPLDTGLPGSAKRRLTPPTGCPLAKWTKLYLISAVSVLFWTSVW